MSSSAYLPSTDPQTWHELYKVALFETDTREIPKRIAEAEKAIKERARQIFATSTDNVEEDQALDDALYALRALQSCLVLQTKAA